MKKFVDASELSKEFDRLLENERFDEAREMLGSIVEKVPAREQTAPFSAPVRVKKQFTAGYEEEGIGIDLANSLARKWRNARYRWKLGNGYSGARILEEGDSWTQYPALLHDIADNIIDEFALYSLGAAGDTIENMSLLGEFVDAIRREEPDLFLLSGGGNDLLGEGRFVTILKRYTSGASAADLIDAEALDAALARVMGHYRSIIDRALDAGSALRGGRGLQVAIHGYDRPIPRKAGPWLGKPLASKGISLELGSQILAIVIDAFNEQLDILAASYGNVRYINLRGLAAQGSGGWHDEIHPNDAGFRNVSAPFIDLISQLKQEAEFLPEATIADPDGWRDAVAVLDDEDVAALPSRGDLIRRVRTSATSDRQRARETAREVMRQDPMILSAWSDLVALKRQIDRPEDPQICKARNEYRGMVQNLERIIGDNDLDEFFVLKRGLRAGRSIARLLVSSGGGIAGTGFLVGPGLILTNNHVLPNRHLATNTIASFDYELDENGLPAPPAHFRLTGDVFLTSEELDYTFASVEQMSMDGRQLADFGHNPLFPKTGKTSKKEYVNIIQHPGGNFKKVALRENQVLGYRHNHVYYVADTQPGSSGGGVFNTEWVVVALHHLAIPDPNDAGKFIANRGVRISRILRDVDVRRQSGEADAVAVDQLVTAGRESPIVPGDDGDNREWASAGAIPALRDGAFSEAAGSTHSKLSDEGYWLIVNHETGGRSYYEGVIRERPVWPGGQSGVTIGCGYDLGYHSSAEFQTDWAARLSQSDFVRLRGMVGKTGQSAKTATATVQDIRIGWETALAVFDARTLPKHVGLTYQALPALDTLHSHSVSALVSLVFNRGASFRKSGDRYREMRAILAHLEAGRPERIPAEIRSMKRLWENSGLGGLLRRRDEEADLFQKGLDAGGSPERAEIALAQEWQPGPADLVVHEGDDLEDASFAEQLDSEGDVAHPPHRESLFEAAPHYSASDARWPNSPTNAPDTWHLPTQTADDEFELTPDLLRAILQAGHFEPVTTAHDKLIVSIRGCQPLSGEPRIEDASSIALRPVNPDHENFRCLIGVWDTQADRISLYLGSTVPRRTGMLRYYNRVNFGGSGILCNMLPTGLYEHCVGTHYGTGGATSYVLRLGDGPDPADSGSATVLRTSNDLIYGTRDVWDMTAPADNIHPAFLAESFSSVGCLTLRGWQKPGGSPDTATGEWKAFRRKAGFDGQNYKRRYDNLLITGHEAASIAALSGSPAVSDLQCLRHGSRGDKVGRLQQQLGISDDGQFGARTRKALVDRQYQMLGFATGSWTARMAQEMNMDF